jgi:hypothetical protein
MFIATFSYVALRALQQRNVAFDNHKWVPMTCYAMAIADIYCVAFVAREGLSLPLVLTNGTAAMFGCFFSMWFHKRFIKQ